MTSKKANGKTTLKPGKLPKGFKEVRTKLDGFFERAPGNSAEGILRGAFEVRGKFGAKKVYRIELTAGETQVGDGEMMGPGAVIGLDETGYTKNLGELEPGTGVYVRYEGKDGESDKAPHIFTVGRADG